MADLPDDGGAQSMTGRLCKTEDAKDRRTVLADAVRTKEADLGSEDDCIDDEDRMLGKYDSCMSSKPEILVIQGDKFDIDNFGIAESTSMPPEEA